MRFETEEDIDVTLNKIALLSNPAWTNFNEDNGFHRAVISCWVHHHRTRLAVEKPSIGEVVETVKAVIPDSYLAKYGSFRYDLEMEEMYSFFEDSNHLKESILQNCLKDLYHFQRINENNENTELFSSFEASAIHGMRNYIACPLNQWISNVEIFLRKLSQILNEECIVGQQTDFYLKICMQFFFALKNNRELHQLMDTDIPFLTNYEQLLQEPISVIELLSIPQPYLKDSLDPICIDRLWLNISADNVRNLWNHNTRNRNLPSFAPEQNYFYKVLNGTTNFLRRNRQGKEKLKPAQDDACISEEKGRHLLGSLLSFIDNFDDETGVLCKADYIGANHRFPEAHGSWTKNLFPNRTHTLNWPPNNSEILQYRQEEAHNVSLSSMKQNFTIPHEAGRNPAKFTCINKETMSPMSLSQQLAMKQAQNSNHLTTTTYKSKQYLMHPPKPVQPSFVITPVQFVIPVIPVVNSQRYKAIIQNNLPTAQRFCVRNSKMNAGIERYRTQKMLPPSKLGETYLSELKIRSQTINNRSGLKNNFTRTNFDEILCSERCYKQHNLDMSNKHLSTTQEQITYCMNHQNLTHTSMNKNNLHHYSNQLSVPVTSEFKKSDFRSTGETQMETSCCTIPGMWSNNQNSNYVTVFRDGLPAVHMKKKSEFNKVCMTYRYPNPNLDVCSQMKNCESNEQATSIRNQSFIVNNCVHVSDNLILREVKNTRDNFLSSTSTLADKELTLKIKNSWNTTGKFSNNRDEQTSSMNNKIISNRTKETCETFSIKNEYKEVVNVFEKFESNSFITKLISKNTSSFAKHIMLQFIQFTGKTRQQIVFSKRREILRRLVKKLEKKRRIKDKIKLLKHKNSVIRTRLLGKQLHPLWRFIFLRDIAIRKYKAIFKSFSAINNKKARKMNLSKKGPSSLLELRNGSFAKKSSYQDFSAKPTEFLFRNDLLKSESPYNIPNMKSINCEDNITSINLYDSFREKLSNRKNKRHKLLAEYIRSLAEHLLFYNNIAFPSTSHPIYLYKACDKVNGWTYFKIILQDIVRHVTKQIETKGVTS